MEGGDGAHRAGFAAAALVLALVAPAALVGCGSGTTSRGTAASRPSTTATATGTVRTGSATTTTTPAASSPTTSSAAALPAGDDTVVSRVVDGDTLVVGGGERIRLIGMDTPETKDPRKPVQCFGREASARTEALVPAGTAVRLVYDVERTDRYGRTLAYVYRTSDALFLNAALVRDGYAVAATFPPNVEHAAEFVALTAEARDAGRGLWGACGGPGRPASG